jgi:hypothetical protein
MPLLRVGKSCPRFALRMSIASEVLHKVASPFREFGLGVGFLYALDRTLARVSSRWHLHAYELMVQPITDKPLLPRRLSRIGVREIAYDDPHIALMPVRPEVMQARKEQRATCLGAFDGERLIGYMWFCRGAYEEDEVRCTYVLAHPEESVFDFDFFIFPEHRLGVGFVALWNGANELLHGAGVRYTFSRLTRFNVASRRAHAHLGWKTVGRALFLQLGTLELMVSTVFPYLAASTRGRVRMKLRPDVLVA